MVDFPKVGVCVLIVRSGKVLMGRRHGSHGSRTWAPPGGHLDMFEGVEQCAAREVLEETGMEIFGARMMNVVTNDIFEDEGRHYVTLYVVAEGLGEAVLMEPDKCEGWAWFDWGDLPAELFLPVRQLVDSGFSPFDMCIS